MYHTMHSPPPLLVQIVSGQQTNGQCTPVQSHSITINCTPSPHQQSPCPTTFLFDENAQNGHNLIQAEGHYPLEVYQTMGVEMPHIRHHGFGIPVPLNSTMNGNWQKRNYNMDYNAPTMPPPHLNFRHHGYTNGVIKKPNWSNKQRRYHNREATGMFGYREQNKCQQYEQYELCPTPLLQTQPLALSSSSSSSSSQAETYHSDSGISGTSSRPTTPIKNLTDFSQTESSDDRDSVSSSSTSKKHEKQKNQEYHEIPRLGLILAHRLNPYNTNSLQYLHQQKHFNFHQGSMPLVRPTQLQQNNQNKKRSGNSKTPPKNVRGKKLSNEILIPPFTSLIAPDRFLNRSHLVQVKKPPSCLLKNCKWDNLSRDIWDKFMACQQSEQTYKNKILLWRYLYIYIKNVYPRYGLYIVGSTINGFGSDSSDVDLCLLVRNAEIIQRYEAITHLGQIGCSLATCNFIDRCDLIEAKVPILRFHDSERNLVVDLNCNNAVGIRNTHMLYCYSQIDWRVRPLVLVVKLWASANGINDAKNMTISSYSLTLMVIHFLQSGVQPAVLPCLHDMYPNKFNSFTDVHGIDMHENLVIPMRPADQSNRQTLGELFYEFFRYYVNFDFNHFAVSVRKPHKLLIDECRFASSWKNDPYQWKYLCIEEPFDLTNTARAVYDYEVFIMIKTVFHRTFQRLKDNQEFASIFPAQVDSKGP